MPAESMTSFPARPLTTADLRSIISHPNIGAYQPLYRRADDPDAIIMLYLESNDRIHMLLYNPAHEGWERVDTIDEPDSLTKESGLNTNASQERFEAYYDADDVEPVDYGDPMEAFAQQFPSEPLTDAQLEVIGERSFIVTVVPFVRHQTDDRLVAVLLVVKDPIEALRIVGSYGYDPNKNVWQLLGTTDTADSADEEAVEAFGEDTVEWLFDEYSQDEVYLVDDADSGLSSQ